jgi:preprotein translocase YajC subunit
VLLQQPAPGPAGLVGFLPIIFIIAIFYLIVLMPARKRQKKLQEMIDGLKTGDKVITTGGIRPVSSSQGQIGIPVRVHCCQALASP